MKKNIALTALILVCSNVLFAQTGNIIVPNGHALKVEMIVPDNQGKYLYTVERSKTIMWDIKTHAQLYTFAIGTTDKRNVALSNDGTKIAYNYKTSVECYSTVTGKPLFSAKKQFYGSCIKFSPDDRKIFTMSFGIISIDVATQQETQLIKTDYIQFDDNGATLDVLDATHIVLINKVSWQIWNIAERKLDLKYTFEPEPYTRVYLPTLKYIATKANQLEFRDIYTGKIVKSFPFGQLVPSINSKEFILYNGESYTIYNGENFTAKQKLREIKDFSYFEGCFSGNTNTVYASNYSDVIAINTKINTVDKGYKRQVADLGYSDVFSSMEYNYSTGILNLMTDDSVYKSINLTKLFAFRHKALPIHTDMTTFSPTGDTIAAFIDHKGYIKNIVTGKFIQPAIKLADEASSTERVNFFFSKDGAQVYYTTYSVPKQMNTLNRISLKTGISEKVLSFRNTIANALHPDKDMLAAVERGTQFEHLKAKVWNVTSGKLLFELDLGETKCDFMSISNDKQKLMLVRNKTQDSYDFYEEIYDIATGNLLSASPKFSNLGFYSSYDCTPDFSLLIKCGNFGSITAMNANGKDIYTNNAHTSSIRRALFSPDSKIMYTVSTDQTIKVWEPKSGKLFGTLYLFNDGNDYVFVDQYGRFDGTEAGIKKLYYLKDRKKIPLDVVYEKFYTPNLYQRLINGEQFSPIDVAIKPSPLVKISYAEAAARNLEVADDMPTYQNKTGFADITVNATAEDDAVDEIRLFHNGKIVTLTTRNLIVADAGSGNDSKKYQLALLPGVNTIRAVALNTQRTESQPDDIVVNYNNGTNAVPANNKPVNNTNGAPVLTVDKNATMHLVVVGINAYQNKSMSLNYALADATSFKDEVEKDAKSIITNIKTYFVTDNTADKTGITNALKEVQQHAKPQDVFIFYYAGHGVIGKNNEFYLVPTDVSDLKNVQTELENKGIAAKLLQQYAIDIPAQKQLFILDACQSAGAFETMLSADGNQQKSIAVVARSTGTHWIAASGAQQFANEFSSLGHGAFTYVLLEALKGAASNNKMITVNNLKNYLQQTVPELMRKYHGAAQYPASYGLGNDFPVEIIK
ncbi:MAG TPA: caspase family protein [Panacibacter sp.]|nr:caspase family protein [Panacibacter sp.]